MFVLINEEIDILLLKSIVYIRVHSPFWVLTNVQLIPTITITYSICNAKFKESDVPAPLIIVI